MTTPPPIEAAHIIKQGYLNKLGGKVHSWKNRHFVLGEKTLHYYVGPDQKYLGTIPIQDCTVSIDCPQDPTGFYFKILLPQSVDAKRNEYLFKAPTEQERKDWIIALNKANIITIFTAPVSRSLTVNPSKPGVYLTIPYFFTQAIEFLEQKSLKSEGLYRLNGAIVQIEGLISQINQNLNVEFNDINVTTGVIKQYTRTLPEPLLMLSNYVNLQKISILSEDKIVDPLRHIIRNLPLSHFIMVVYFFQHLRKVLENEASNLMNLQAISVCIGPSLIRVPEENANDAFGEATIQQKICAVILTRYDEIFTHNPLLIYNSAGKQFFAKLNVEQNGDSPYALVAPAESIIQIIAEDTDGFAIAVYESKWGIVHRDFYTADVSPKDIISGLAKQKNKWKLEQETLTSLGQKCPEAVELYRILSQRLTDYRNKT